MSAFPLSFLILLGVALLVSSMGFKNYVWFISLGYGFSIAAEGIAMLIYYHKTLSVASVLLSALFIAYGLRLSGYLAIREAKSASYKKHMTSEIKDGKTVSERDKPDVVFKSHRADDEGGCKQDPNRNWKSGHDKSPLKIKVK